MLRPTIGPTGLSLKMTLVQLPAAAGAGLRFAADAQVDQPPILVLAQQDAAVVGAEHVRDSLGLAVLILRQSLHLRKPVRVERLREALAVDLAHGVEQPRLRPLPNPRHVLLAAHQPRVLGERFQQVQLGTLHALLVAQPRHRLLVYQAVELEHLAVRRRHQAVLLPRLG